MNEYWVEGIFAGNILHNLFYLEVVVLDIFITICGAERRTTILLIYWKPKKENLHHLEVDMVRRWSRLLT